MPAVAVAIGIAVLVSTLVWIGHDHPRGTSFGESPTAPGITRLTAPDQTRWSAQQGATDRTTPTAGSAGIVKTSPTAALAASVSGPPVLLTIPTLDVNTAVDEILSDGAVLRPLTIPPGWAGGSAVHLWERTRDRPSWSAMSTPQRRAQEHCSGSLNSIPGH